MFEFQKRDERVSNIENRVSAIGSRMLMLENDFQYRLGQFHKLMSDMSDMRDHVAKLEDELTIAKNLLITRKHAEIKKHEAPVEDVSHAEVIAVRKRRKSKRYDASDAPDVALRKSLDREHYWRTKAKELESQTYRDLLISPQQPEAPQ